MKKLIIFLFISIFIVKHAYAFQNEPGGFSEIKWGTDRSRLSDMKYSSSAPLDGRVKSYYRKSDKLQMGDVKLSKIEYSFYNGEFYNASITAKKSRDCTRLRGGIVKRYGPWTKEETTRDDAGKPLVFIWSWEGNVTSIQLYDQVAQDRCILDFTSQKILEQMEEER